jgi:hypothetical protein
VIGRQHGVLLVAMPSGLVRVLPGRAAVGMRIGLNGGRINVLGRAQRAVFDATVVRQSGNLTFLSAAGHLLAVRDGRRLASTNDSAPPAGTVVQTTVAIDDQGELDDHGEQQLGQTGGVQVQATIAAVGAGTITVNVNGQQLTLPLPAGLTLPASLIGSQVTLSLSFTNGQTTVQGEDDQGDDDQQGDDDSQGAVTPSSTTIGIGSGAATNPNSGQHSGQTNNSAGDD